MEHHVKIAEAAEAEPQTSGYVGLDTLSTGGTISVTEEVAGQRYVVQAGRRS